MVVNMQEGWCRKTDSEGSCSAVWQYWNPTRRWLHLEEIWTERDTRFKVPEVLNQNMHDWERILLTLLDNTCYMTQSKHNMYIWTLFLDMEKSFYNILKLRFFHASLFLPFFQTLTWYTTSKRLSHWLLIGKNEFSKRPKKIIVLH